MAAAGTADARISAGFPTHPKTKRLIRRLGIPGAWALFRLWLWTAENKPDGDLAGQSDEDLEIAVDWNPDAGALVDTLVELRFLDGPPGARRVHDWHEHNPWNAKRAERSEGARAAALARWGRRDDPMRDAREFDAHGNAQGIESDAARIDAQSAAHDSAMPPTQPNPTHTPEGLGVSPSSAEPKPGRKRKKSDADARATRLPEDWKPSHELQAAMRAERPDVSQRVEFPKFRDHFIAAPGRFGRKNDWDATYRNWIRNAKPTPRAGGPIPPQSKTAAGREALRGAIDAIKTQSADMVSGGDSRGLRQPDPARIGPDAGRRAVGRHDSDVDE